MTLSSFGNNLKVAIIGASGGIGRSFVEECIQSGQVSEIYAISRSEIVFDSDKVISLSMDLTDEKTIERAATQIQGELDIVIIATGMLHAENISPEKSLNDLTMDKFAEIYAVNTFGPALVIKYFSRFLPRDRKSVLAALSARVGSIGDNRMGGWYAYRSSKTALNMILKNASIELSRRYKHSCIIGLHPGTVDTTLSTPFQDNVQPDKLFTSVQSVSYLWSVIDKTSPQNTGCVFAWDGKIIEN